MAKKKKRSRKRRKKQNVVTDIVSSEITRGVASSVLGGVAGGLGVPMPEAQVGLRIMGSASTIKGAGSLISEMKKLKV